MVRGVLFSQQTSAGAYVSRAHAAGSVSDSGLRMSWQPLSCSGERNPWFRLGSQHRSSSAATELRMSGGRERAADRRKYPDGSQNDRQASIKTWGVRGEGVGGQVDRRRVEDVKKGRQRHAD